MKINQLVQESATYLFHSVAIRYCNLLCSQLQGESVRRCVRVSAAESDVLVLGLRASLTSMVHKLRKFLLYRGKRKY